MYVTYIQFRCNCRAELYTFGGNQIYFPNALLASSVANDTVR